jgi:signal transduction histidine kinase
MRKQLLPEVELIIDEKSEKQIIPDVKTDCDRLTQILKQLISNAIKYTQKGEIKVGYGINQRERLLEFDVSDTGIGISEENRQKIFQRFTKLDPFAQGTGLGLSICKALIEQMGGNIDLESSPGNGTTFRFSIPYAPVETPVS